MSIKLGISLQLWVIILVNTIFVPSAWAAEEPAVVGLGEADIIEPERDQPATSVTEWLAQIEETLVQITGVQVNSTEQGLDIVLSTNTDALNLPATATEGNRLTAVIPNAVLVLPDGPEYRQVNPATGIAEVNVTPLPGDQVQVEIVGTEAPPIVTVQNEATGLVLAVETAPLAVSEEDEELEITVTAENVQEGYVVPNATTGTRTDTPIRDVPQSIQVIPRKVLEDQQVIRLDEALRNISGITANTDSGRGLEFRVRGFGGVPLLRNGFRSDFRQGQTFPETANIEQVEVLKGPASILYGEIQPGGVINLVTKRPLSEPFYKLQAQFGNRDLIRPSVDLSGPLTPDGKLLYRLNALYQRSDEIQDFDTDIERFFISPVLTWEINDRTDVTLEL